MSRLFHYTNPSVGWALVFFEVVLVSLAVLTLVLSLALVLVLVLEELRHP